MIHLALGLALSLTLTAEPVAEKPKLLVTALTPAGGVTPEVAGAITEAITTEVAQRGFFQPMSAQDIQTILGTERQRQLMGCAEDLAPPLPAASLPVTQYLQHCGQLFAVAADGVRRLTAGTGPTGTWEAVPVPGDLRYTQARLFAHGEELRLFTSEGVALQLSGFQCRAPAQ